MEIEAEGLAAEVVEATQYEPYEDPYVVPHRMGLRVMAGRSGVQPTAAGKIILIDPSVRAPKRRFDAIHEALHLVRRARREPDPERLINAATAAVLCPREPFHRALRRHGWIVEALATEFPFVSQETIARRVVSMRCAVLWVWDVAPEPRRYRVISPGWRWPLREPTPVECEAMDAALADRCAVEPIGGVRAWPVIDGPWTRVLCLSDGETLLSQVA